MKKISSIFKLTENQKDFLFNSNYRINLVSGTGISGNTYVCILRWIRFLIEEAKESQMAILMAPSIGYIKQHIVSPIQELTGWDIEYDRQDYIVKINGISHIMISSEDPNAIQRYCGCVVIGAYCEDVETYDESLIMMLLTRLSKPNAKAFLVTTNPSKNPNHYLKTDFIDREKEINYKNEDCFHHWNIKLTENASFDNDFVDMIMTSSKKAT